MLERKGSATPAAAFAVRLATAFPAWSIAKSDAQVCAVDPALEHANVTLQTNSYVERLETNPSGREISKVIIKNNGTREEVSADIVVSSCGAINSAALLLRSANDKHPNGLANSSDVVGRHYMGHINSVLMAISKCPNPTIFQKSLSVNDFYFGTAGWNYPMGHISFVGKLDGETLKGGAPGPYPWLDARCHGQALARFLAHLRGSARSGQPRDPRRQWRHRPQLPTQQ